jgi:hypothetical protein
MTRAVLIALALVIAANGTAEAKHHRHHKPKIIVRTMTEAKALAGIEREAGAVCELPDCTGAGPVIANGALVCDHKDFFVWACFAWTNWSDGRTCRFREYVNADGIDTWDVTYGDQGWQCEREEDRA